MLARVFAECNVGSCCQPLTRRKGIAISAAPGTSGLLALDWISWAMTGSRLSSDGLDARRKRLLFRCWHRGTKELDLIIGGFADAHLPMLTDNELDQLEEIIEAPEPELYAALTSDGPAPQGVSGPLFEKIKSFRVVDQLK
jgi:antitoxin CptB